MLHMFSRPSSLCFTFILVVFCKGISGATFTFTNRCGYTVWPGILASSGSNRLDTTGFELQSGGSRSMQAPPGWSGRFWGRTGCNFDVGTGLGSCASGDCGTNQMECNGAGAAPPATLAEFTLGSGSATNDFYDVSLVDGYNLPMTVEASGGSGNCETTGCVKDLNRLCPSELRVGNGQACNSACRAFGNAEYCCSGDYGSPNTCRPSYYSTIFKSACPRSYSYAYDDASSTFTCSGADYTITFCPSTTSQKSSTAADWLGSGGSREDPTTDIGSWLPNFLTGDSPQTTISRFDTGFRAIASLTTFLFLCFSHF